MIAKVLRNPKTIVASGVTGLVAILSPEVVAAVFGFLWTNAQSLLYIATLLETIGAGVPVLSPDQFTGLVVVLGAIAVAKLAYENTEKFKERLSDE